MFGAYAINFLRCLVTKKQYFTWCIRTRYFLLLNMEKLIFPPTPRAGAFLIQILYTPMWGNGHFCPSQNVVHNILASPSSPWYFEHILNTFWRQTSMSRISLNHSSVLSRQLFIQSGLEFHWESRRRPPSDSVDSNPRGQQRGEELNSMELLSKWTWLALRC